MKPNEPLPLPNIILVRSLYSGLAALVRLASKRKNKRTQEFYQSIEKQWKQVREDRRNSKHTRSRDYSDVQNAEANIRKQYLLMLWYSTKPYGNKETKRVISWESGTVGPLNSLLNYAGARLRELAATRYPFPEPVFYQVRKLHDGSEQVLSYKAAEAIPKKEGDKSVHWRAGYRGNANHPMVLLSHPTLPGMDFVDMIRAHLIELCRQCFIHNVPFYDSHRYIRLLVHKLKPFLDWVYTGGETGKKDFIPDAEKELRTIVLEIKTLHGKRIGRRPSITGDIEEEIPEPTIDMLRTKIIDLLRESTNPETRSNCVDILDRIDQGVIVDRDVQKISEHAVSLSQKEGNDWHRVLLSSIHHPASLKSVVFNGDAMMERTGDILAVGELPVVSEKRQGKADVTLFMRRQVSGRVVWTPIMLLDIKVKGAYEFNLFSEQSKSGKDYMPTNYVWKRNLSEEEWEQLLTSIPEQTTLQQLGAYENGLVQGYRQLVNDDLSAPSSLWKGVIVVDPNQPYSQTYDAFQGLLAHLSENIEQFAVRVSRWETLEAEPDSDRRLGLILSPSLGPSHLVSERLPLEELPEADPFQYRVKDSMLLTVYISVASASSEGQAAAWIAKNWHLLNHVSETEERQDVQRVIWLDLLGDFPSEKLRAARFGLDQLLRQREITQKTHRTLELLLQSIEFVDLSDIINEYTLGRSDTNIGDAIGRVFKSSGRGLVIVDGWDELSQLVPPNRQHLLRILEDTLLKYLPQEGSNIIWVDRGAAHSGMNPWYQRSCLDPLPYDSPRLSILDEIMWNLPLRPRELGWQTPEDTELRIIAQDLPINQEPWCETIQVPHLKDWRQKFRGTSRRDGTMDESTVALSRRKTPPMYDRSVNLSSIQGGSYAFSDDDIAVLQDIALTLIPSILRSRNGTRSHDEKPPPPNVTLVLKSVDYSRHALSLTARVSLNTARGPLRTKCKPFSLITRGWMYGSVPTPDEYVDEWQGVSRRPTLREVTPATEIDDLNARKREVRRLLSAVKFLGERQKYPSDLSVCCMEIRALCQRVLSEEYDEQSLLATLKDARRIVLGNYYRAETWELLKRTREGLADMLNSDNYRSLQRALDKNREILTVYGLNLFLAVYSVLDEIMGDHKSPAALYLWSSIGEWELHQMGFRTRDVTGYESWSKYDFHAVYSNLQRRARQMRDMPHPKGGRFVQRTGQLVWNDSADGIKAWLFFPKKGGTTVIGALLQDLQSVEFRHGWYRASIDPEELSDAARMAIEDADWTTAPIIIAKVQGHDILFMETDSDDGRYWSMIGVLEYGSPPKGNAFPIRWLRVSDPPPEVYSLLQGFQVSSGEEMKRNIGSKILQKAASWSGIMQDVTCHLTINTKKEKYVIDIKDGRKTIARKETEFTDEVSRFLRQSLRTGQYLKLKDGRFLKWDHTSDVEYDEVRLEKGTEEESLYLSILKPFIHRYAFYPETLQLPITARQLLNTTLSGEITLRVFVDEELRQMRLKKYLKIQLDGLDSTSPLKSLEEERFGIFDSALLMECEQLVDTESMKRYDIMLDVTNLVGLRLPLGVEKYDRMHSALLSEYDRECDVGEGADRPLEKVEKSGPLLMLDSIDIEESGRPRRINVVVRLSNNEEDFIEQITVYSITSELARSQGIIDAGLENEIRSELSSRRISEDTLNDIISRINGKIREYGVHVIEF
jgi:hypothetical protein